MTYEDYKNSGKFSIEQLDEICLGFGHGLFQEQIELYAKPEFSNLQMYEIYQGFRNGLSQEQVKFYADAKFKYNQMREIRIGFNDKMPNEQISIFATPKFDWEQMYNIRCFIKGADDKQIQQLKESIDAGLSYNQFFIYLNVKVPAENMRVYLALFKQGCGPENVGLFVKKSLPYETLKKIKFLMNYANYFNIQEPIDKDDYEIDSIDESIKCKILSKLEIKDEKAYDILDKCIELKLSAEYLNIIFDKRFTIEQMTQLAIASLNDFSINELKALAVPEKTAEEIKSEVNEAIASKIRNSCNEIESFCEYNEKTLTKNEENYEL